MQYQCARRAAKQMGVPTGRKSPSLDGLAATGTIHYLSLLSAWCLQPCHARCCCTCIPCHTHSAVRAVSRRFPSSYFYDGQLQDGETISAAARAAPCHGHPLLGPLVLLDCREGRERAGRAGGGAGGASLRNTAEAELVAELYMGGWLGAGGGKVCS